MKSKKERIENRLETIATFSEEENALTRRTFSKAYKEAVDYVTQEMQELGMEVRLDSFGNLIGRYNPGNSKEKPIGIGSHLDSVVNAGKYDGVAGIVVGLELVSMLRESGVTPKAPIEVLATADEEGSICQKGYFGARFMIGDMTEEEIISYKNAEGKNILTLREESGMFAGVPLGRDLGWAKDYYQEFLEVHVEQGSTLEKKGKSVGIVEGVAGIGRLFFTFHGESDHAGPTMMDERKDAMVAAADFMLHAYHLAQGFNEKAVITTARISNTPNIHNVISSETSLIADYRSIDDSLSQMIADNLKTYANTLYETYGVSVEVTNEVFTPVTLFDESLKSQLRELQMPESMDLYSWAGHDAKAFASVVPTAMVFMPSIGGKSHSPLEFTPLESFTMVCDSLVKLL